MRHLCRLRLRHRRVASDRLGLVQRVAAQTIEVCRKLMIRGNLITIRWITAHLGAGGNEISDLYAKGAAERELYAVDGAHMRETNFAHLMRLTTGARTSGTNSWIAILNRGRRGNRPPRGGRLRPRLCHEGRVLTDQYQHLLAGHSGHAATGTFLCNRLHKIPSDTCWWCGRAADLPPYCRQMQSLGP